MRTNPANARCGSIEEVEAACGAWDTRRLSLEYEVDGVVVKIDDLGLQEELLGVDGVGPQIAASCRLTSPIRHRGRRCRFQGRQGDASGHPTLSEQAFEALVAERSRRTAGDG